MRILHIAHAALPLGRGGVETYLWRLLPALVEHGIDSALLLPVKGNGELQQVATRHPGVAVFAGGPGSRAAGFGDGVRSWRSNRAHSTARRTLDEWQPDLVHVHQLMFHDTRIYGLAQERGLPVLTSVHDYWFACQRTILVDSLGRQCPGSPDGRLCAPCLAEGSGLRRMAWRLLAGRRQASHRKALLRSDGIAVPSPATAQTLAGALGLVKVDAEVLPYPVPALSEPPASGVGSVAAASPQGAIARVGYIGSFRAHKGLHVLAAAAARLRRRGFDLVAHGDPAVDPSYARKVAKTSGGAIRFAGPFEPEEIRRVLDGIDILVVPSLWRETGPQVALEALAAGKTVVGSRLGGLSELEKSHPQRVHLVEPGSAEDLLRVILRASASSSSPQSAGMLSISDHVDRLARMYGRRLAAARHPW